MIMKIMRNALLLSSLLQVGSAFAQQKAPAYPLITHDPYFSIWSATDDLNASTTRHWTGTDQSRVGFLKVDVKTYRFVGQNEKESEPVLAASDESAYTASYTEQEPGAGWMQDSFDDSQWKTGAAPFGDNHHAKTNWKSKDLWVRRVFDLTKTNY